MTDLNRILKPIMNKNENVELTAYNLGFVIKELEKALKRERELQLNLEAATHPLKGRTLQPRKVHRTGE